ncbi:hypothetical protein MLD38_013240 [Melastoma candidum]|uniref:Uncharacterized protein n=1 Tax=Melastoma candidum TaxID=119954 RepID=A0ACB9R8W5_9MYRT|nr:hypothetical protein MLD38_013240 [Melastoma candidum]
MGDAACLAPPFSYASGVGLSCDHHTHLEGNPMSTLTQSISFGRFVSESASWNRWSVFPTNRYVEEAEKFSRPGSVAQKKAFFEAHYKEMAARKKAAAAAALLEQANAPVSTDPVQSDCGVAEESSSKNGSPSDNLNNEEKEDIIIESQEHECSKSLQVTPEVHISRSCAEIGERESDRLWKTETSHVVLQNRTDDMAVEQKIITNSIVCDEPANLVASNHCNEGGNTELSGSSEMEKLLLKDFVREDVMEDTDLKKQVVACSKIPRSHKASSRVTAPPAMATSTPLPYWKGNNITPKSRNSSVLHVDIKRPTPRRLPLGNLTPIREISKPIVSRKVGSQKTFGGMIKHFRTPSKTPTVGCSSLKYTLVTPKSESKRTPMGDGRQTGPKRRSLANECSKFLSSCKSKLQSPSLSTPFRLRTEERATRRKAKLEEKFDADEREKQELQNLLKEREEMEVKRFRQTLCFKARPLPKFYSESPAMAKSLVKKVESSSLESAKHNRKPWSSTAMPRGGGVMPPLQGKKPVLDISERCNPARENRSLNIRQ